MRKNNTVGKSASSKKEANGKLTVGIDLGDRSSRYRLGRITANLRMSRGGLRVHWWDVAELTGGGRPETGIER